MHLYDKFKKNVIVVFLSGQMAASRNVVYLPQGQQTLLSLPQ